MSTTLINTANTEGVDFNQTYTAYDQTAAISSTNDPSIPAPPFRAGTVVKGSFDSEFVFIKASAAIAIGDAVTIDQTNYAATGVTTTNAAFGDLIGVAQVAIASGAYGWVQRAGPGLIHVAASCAGHVQLAATANAGILDDAVTTALKAINGIIITTTIGATATTQVGTLNYPIVGSTFA